MFRICITSAASFSASTIGTGYDTELFLFDHTGRGVSFNNDAPGGETLESYIGSDAVTTTGNGTYYLAVTAFGKYPTDAGGQLLWVGGADQPPDGPGAANPVGAWPGDVYYLAAGPYIIMLTGVSFCPPPCVADFDDGSGTGTPDGGVGIEDLLYYLTVYNAGVVRADVDDGSGTGTPDGGVGIEDLLYFLTRYNAGC